MSFSKVNKPHERGLMHHSEDHVERGNGPTVVKSNIGYLQSGPMPPRSPVPRGSVNSTSLDILHCEPDRKSANYLEEHQATSHRKQHRASGSDVQTNEDFYLSETLFYHFAAPVCRHYLARRHTTSTRLCTFSLRHFICVVIVTSVSK